MLKVFRILKSSSAVILFNLASPLTIQLKSTVRFPIISAASANEAEPLVTVSVKLILVVPLIVKSS